MRHHMNYSKAQLPLFAFIVLLVASFTLLLTPAQGQTLPASTATTPASITFSGTIDSIDTRFIVVNGLLVDLVSADYDSARLQTGVEVTVVGTLQNGIINAVFLQFGGDDDDSSTPSTPVTATPVPVTPTAATTPSQGTPTGPGSDDDRSPRIIIEGPVRNINAEVIQVFDIEINIAPTTVIVNNISIGDNVRIEGNLTIINNIINITAININIINIDAGLDSRRSDRSFSPPPPPQNNRGSRSSRSSRSS